MTLEKVKKQYADQATVIYKNSESIYIAILKNDKVVQSNRLKALVEKVERVITDSTKREVPNYQQLLTLDRPSFF